MNSVSVINYADIITDSLVDGDGLRTVLFVQGCERDCPGCHNKSTHGKGGNVAFVWELVGKLLKTSHDGKLNLTISGGEPMLQSKELVDLVLELSRVIDLNLWVYTGYKIDELTDEQFKLVAIADVVVDGMFVEALQDETLQFRGSSNQRIIDTGQTFLNGTLKEPVLWEEKI